MCSECSRSYWCAVARRPAVVLAAVWAASVLALAGCDSREVEKIERTNQVEEAGAAETASGKHGDALQVQAEPVRLSVGLTVEPYIFNPQGASVDRSGFEVDIVREALALEGHDVEFVHEPLGRTKISFKQGHVDGVMDVKEYYPEIEGSFLSDEHVTYYNYAVSLKSRNLEISEIADLMHKRVVAFQQARIAFGEEFAAMAEDNPGYLEVANQESQIAMLFLGRADVLVLDRRIFMYHRNRLTEVPVDQPVSTHELFEPSNFRIAFDEREIRDAFNRGLRKIRESGRYEEIVGSYVGAESHQDRSDQRIELK